MRTFLDARDGNISVMFALMAVVILGGAGLGLDYMLWAKQRTEIQEAADAGALAGAVELGKGGADVVSRAEAKALAIGAANTSGAAKSATMTVGADPVAQTVTLSLTMPGRRSISAVLLKADATLAATSTARVVNRVLACIYALNPSSAKSMLGNGTALLEGTNCAIQVNSSDPAALDNTGTIKATHICVAGGFNGSGYSPTPRAGCPVVEDPFIAAVIPAPGACSETGLSVNSNTTLWPGVYCGGVSIASSAVATLKPGVYHLVDSSFKVSGGGSVVGDEVVFVLSGTASLDISGNGKVRTTPPAAGGLAGFSIVQDRAAPLGGQSKITGEGQFEFPGVIYLPRQSLEIRGRAAGNSYVPTYAAVAADKIVVAGSGELRVTADVNNLAPDAMKLSVVNVSLVR